MNMQILDELTRFVAHEGNVRWYSVPTDHSTASRLGLDPDWTRVLTQTSSLQDRVRQRWSVVEEKYPRTMAVLADKSIGLGLLQTEQAGVSIVYLFRNGDELLARRGYLPTSEFPAFSNGFSKVLEDFYGVHDGLVNFMSYDGGPLSVRDWRVVQDEAGDGCLVKVAMDGSEAFGFDTSEIPCAAYVIRPWDDEVALVMDVCAYLDDLMAARLEDL